MLTRRTQSCLRSGRLPDFLLTDLAVNGVAGPTLDLAEDGFVYIEVSMEPVGGGQEIDAVVRLDLSAPKPSLYRSSVADLWAGWQLLVPLPITPASNIDPGWPRPMDVPGSLVDTEVLRAHLSPWRCTGCWTPPAPPWPTDCRCPRTGRRRCRDPLLKSCCSSSSW